ncbi:glucose-1-phosphate adenylyltransferase [Alteribacillus persepolensis]|uniref:Glucose-1-phosphate adenylyltransferase n=2 Tax=Alteribacillus persepolensis TaxID=568899 RepID=A0A1G8DBT1_9BACI|nr:glucose-1-phosphate adenylyltransferase [Alteribacillus persepolensis]
MGVVNLDSEYDFLQELTYFRCGAAVPFAGRYRLIDFTLSNMCNAGIRDIAVFTRNKYRSLMDHLGTGAEWDLDRKRGGLFILPPDWNDPTDVSKGDLQHFHNNRDFFSRGSSQYVCVSGSQFVSNIPLHEAFRHHLQTEADITLITKTFPTLEEEHRNCLKTEHDEYGWVTALTNDKTNPAVFSGMYIIGKRLFLDLVEECISRGKENLFHDGIKNNLDKLHIQTYQHEGYAAVVNSLESYYKHNMRLLDPEKYRELFFSDHVVYTKIKDEPPVKYNSHIEVKNSLIANGCVIKGEVENSIIFRGVKIDHGAKVKNSIVMQRCHIEEGAVLEDVIIDKDVTVSKNRMIIGAKEQPYAIAKRSTI